MTAPLTPEARRERYAAVIRETYTDQRHVADDLAEAVMAVADAEQAEHGQDTNRAARALAEVRHLCEVTIASSVRVQAIDQARDTLDIINRVMDQSAGECRG